MGQAFEKQLTQCRLAMFGVGGEEDDDDEEFTLIVTTHLHVQYEINVRKSVTIANLKQTIFELYDIPYEQLKFAKNSTVLMDEFTLGDAKISRNDPHIFLMHGKIVAKQS